MFVIDESGTGFFFPSVMGWSFSASISAAVSSISSCSSSVKLYSKELSV
jgi:hypothetical protein